MTSCVGFTFCGLAGLGFRISVFGLGCCLWVLHAAWFWVVGFWRLVVFVVVSALDLLILDFQGSWFSRFVWMLVGGCGIWISAYCCGLLSGV